MIGKVSVGNSFGGIVNYLLNEKKNPEILDSNGVMLESKESIIDSFNYQRSMNRNLGKAVWHSSISFAYPDKVDTELMKQVVNDYIHQIGLSDTQFLVVKHNDRQHKHVHILANRVNNSGDTVSDSFAANRTVKIMQSLEKSYSLTVAKESENQIKKELKDTIKSSIENGDTLVQVFAKVEKIGYEVLLNKDKNNKVTGVSYSMKSKGFILKASQVDRSLSYLKMKKLVEDVTKRNEAFKVTKFEQNHETLVIEESPISNEVYSYEKPLVELKSSEINKVSDASVKANHDLKTEDSETIQDKQAQVVHSKIKSVEASKVKSEVDLISTDLSIHGSSITTGVVPNIEENSSFRNKIVDHASPKEIEKLATVEDSKSSGENPEIEKNPITEERRKEESLLQTSFIEGLEEQQSIGSSEGAKGEVEMVDNALSIQDVEKNPSTNQVVNEKDKLDNTNPENGVPEEVPKESVSENNQDIEAIKLSTDFRKSINSEDLEYSKGERAKESIDPKTPDENIEEEEAKNQLPLFGQEERKKMLKKSADKTTNTSPNKGEVFVQKPDKRQEGIKSTKDEIIKTTAEQDKEPDESEPIQKVAIPIKVEGTIGASLETNKSKQDDYITYKPGITTDTHNIGLSDKSANQQVSGVKGVEPIQSEKAAKNVNLLEKKPNLDRRGINTNEGKRENVVSNETPVKEVMKRDKTSSDTSSEPIVVKGNQLLSNKMVEGTVSEITASPNDNGINFKLTCTKTKKEYSCSVSKKTWFKQLFMGGFQKGALASVGNNNVSILKVPKSKTYPITGIIDSVYKNNSENLLVINL